MIFVMLADPINGGPASAYQCKVKIDLGQCSPAPGGCVPVLEPCDRVTRTKRGMIMHLWHCHKIKIQMEMFK